MIRTQNHRSEDGVAVALSPSFAPLIEANQIVKRFGAILANDVDHFEVRAREVHALLGENGAGKSTLSKILYGFYRPDAGTIMVHGAPTPITTPARARSLGIGMVFQDFTLIPALTVFENIVLFMRSVPAIPDRRALSRQIEAAAARLGISLDLAVPVGTLAVGDRQHVEILKQVVAGARVLILDEPTKVLAPQERIALFALVSELRANDFGIVFITHKLNEVMEIADRISVMRKGRIVGCIHRADATETGLMALMFEGRIPQRLEPAKKRLPGKLALELRDVGTDGRGRMVSLRGIALQLREGEVVGVAGVAGSGQRELGDLVVGRIAPASGSKRLWGDEAGNWSVAQVRRSGVAFVPENPMETACVGDLSVEDNFALGDTRYRRGAGIDRARLAADIDLAFGHLGFPRPAPNTRMRTLSGGNVQRVVMARELGTHPRLVVALYPARGLDVHSAQAVRDKLTSSAAQGTAVLLMSEDLEDLFALCDRIVVLRQGRISGEFLPADFTPEKIGAAMVGASAVGLAETQHAH